MNIFKLQQKQKWKLFLVCTECGHMEKWVPIIKRCAKCGKKLKIAKYIKTF